MKVNTVCVEYDQHMCLMRDYWETKQKVQKYQDILSDIETLIESIRTKAIDSDRLYLYLDDVGFEELYNLMQFKMPFSEYMDIAEKEHEALIDRRKDMEGYQE